MGLTEKSNGAQFVTIEKQNSTAENSKTQPPKFPNRERKYPKEVRYIRLEELEYWEHAGWHALSHYKIASDEIHSIIIGKFDE